MNYNINTIQSELLTVVGFDQPQDPQFETLSTNLTTSLSGIKINDGYVPYLNLQTIKDTSTWFDNFVFSEFNTLVTYTTGNKIKYTYPTWLVGTTYAIGQRVVLNGVAYESLIAGNIGNTPNLFLNKWTVKDSIYGIYEAIFNASANLNKQPDLQPTFWTEKNLFNTFLENRLKSAISNVVNKCVGNQNNIHESKRLYYGIGNGSELITNEDKIVGLKFDLIKNENIKLKINRIGIYFTGAVTDLEIFLYNQNTLITSQKFTTVSNDFAWFNLTNFELTTDLNGSFFLYYNQTGLTEQAINNNILIPQNHSQFVKINPFKCAVGTDLKTITQNDYQYNYSFISNIDYSIVPDLTTWISLNKLLFGEAIRLQFSMDIYKMFFTDDELRSNRTERNLDKEILKSSIYTSEAETLLKQLNTAIEEVRVSIGKAKIDCLNLPTKGFVINYNSIY